MLCWVMWPVSAATVCTNKKHRKAYAHRIIQQRNIVVFIHNLSSLSFCHYYYCCYVPILPNCDSWRGTICQSDKFNLPYGCISSENGQRYPRLRIVHTSAATSTPVACMMYGYIRCWVDWVRVVFMWSDLEEKKIWHAIFFYLMCQPQWTYYTDDGQVRISYDTSTGFVFCARTSHNM